MMTLLTALMLSGPAAAQEFDSTTANGVLIEQRIFDEHGQHIASVFPPQVDTDALRRLRAELAEALLDVRDARDEAARLARDLAALQAAQVEREEALEAARDRLRRRSEELSNLLAGADKFSESEESRRAFREVATQHDALIREDRELIAALERELEAGGERVEQAEGAVAANADAQAEAEAEVEVRRGALQAFKEDTADAIIADRAAAAERARAEQARLDKARAARQAAEEQAEARAAEARAAQERAAEGDRGPESRPPSRLEQAPVVALDVPPNPNTLFIFPAVSENARRVQDKLLTEIDKLPGFGLPGVDSDDAQIVRQVARNEFATDAIIDVAGGAITGPVRTTLIGLTTKEAVKVLSKEAIAQTVVALGVGELALKAAANPDEAALIINDLVSDPASGVDVHSRLISTSSREILVTTAFDTRSGEHNTTFLILATDAPLRAAVRVVPDPVDDPISVVRFSGEVK